MKFKTRRFVGDIPRIIGRSWEDVTIQVQEFFDKLAFNVTGAIPGGFNDVDPETLDPNESATPGTEAAGWAAADHKHALDLLLSLKGHLLSHDGSTYIAVPLGAAPDGYILTADAAEAAGFKWAPAPGSESNALTGHEDAVLRSLTESYAVRDLIARNYT